MVELHTIEQISIVFGEFALVAMTVLIWKEISHIREAFHFTKLHSRPWVGPSSGNISRDKDFDEKEKYVIKIKNFGKSPAKNVTVNFIVQEQKLSKNSVKNSQDNKFSLGPLLPEMEKNYWFYIDSDKMQKARSNAAEVYIGLYISYDLLHGKNGYGIIGHFDSHENNFVKTEMWED